MTTWAERIKLAKKNKQFSVDDRHFAEEWEFCAVGERISSTTAPTAWDFLGDHSSLIEAGKSFCEAVQFDHPYTAARLHKEIQEYFKRMW